MRAAGLSPIAALLIAVGAPAARAVAADASAADGLTLDVIGNCPDAEAVRRLLAGLVSAEEARTAPVVIQDRGSRYRISVKKTAMMLDDPERRCAERARHAAVVASNELHAPKIIHGPPIWTVEKGVVIDAAPFADGGAVYSWGAEFRGAYGSKAWSLMGSAGARGPVTLKLENGWRAELLRFPLDVAGRLTSYRWKLRMWVAVGGTIVPTGVIGQELVDTDREWRVDVGAIGMAGATLPIGDRLGLAAALAIRWLPRRYELQVDPAGKVGETPAWWISLSGSYIIDGKPSVPP
jgi:hypothetical protein